MEITIEIFISGENFCPKEFNQNLPVELKGLESPYRKLRNKEVKESGFWTTKPKSVKKGYVEDVLLDVVCLYAPYIKPLANRDNISKYASIYGAIVQVEKVHGFFFKQKLIKVCAELGLEIVIGLHEKL